MINISDFIPLIGRKVLRILIDVWPPSFATKMLDVDMSIALEFDDSEGAAFHIEIDKADGWTPIVSKVDFVEAREWSEYSLRIEGWMSGRIEEFFQYEVFDATHDSLFENILHREILDVECVTLKSEFNPFAIKLIFSDDYIVVSPINDGTTFETMVFNKLGNLEIHAALGELEFVSMKNHKS